MNKPNIYISGPITGIANYQDNFSECEKYIKAEGIYNPVNPATGVWELLRRYKKIPDYNKLKTPIHYNDEPSYNHYMMCALILMMQNNCQDIILLNRWQYSTGACIELLYAKFFGYKIHLYFKNIKNGNKRVELKNNYRNKY